MTSTPESPQATALEQARKMLEHYGRHDDDCNVNIGGHPEDEPGCDCGLEYALHTLSTPAPRPQEGEAAELRRLADALEGEVARLREELKPKNSMIIFD